MNEVTARTQPRVVQLDESNITLRLMGRPDEDKVLAFARATPEHDLLFLRRDITQTKVVKAWLGEIEAGNFISMLALRDDRVEGCVTVVRDSLSWSKHVGEIRVIVSSAMRGKGLGRLLIQEGFAIALGLGLEKLTAQMTIDQRGAIEIFEGLGFRGEALLRDHVKDLAGKKYDVVVLSHDVARFEAQHEAFGVNEAF
jgi:RimJ/RimL family protein N-acetyltransferase